MTLARLFLLLSVLFLLASCGNNEGKTETSEQYSGEESVYVATGIIEIVEKEKMRVQISHDDIDGYMSAMTMWFEVKDEQVMEKLAGFLRGTKIRFELVKRGLDPSFIRSVEKRD